jgi:hypothetical protein
MCPRTPLSTGEIDALSEAVRSVKGAEVHWLLSDHELDECGELLGAADRLLFLTQALHEFFMGEIRWTEEQRDATRDGIPLDNLDLSPSDRAAIQVCRDWGALQLLGRMGKGRNLEKLSSKAVASASAIGLITMPSVLPPAYLYGGRSVERMWLIATQCGVAVHPMTALPYLLKQAPDNSPLDSAGFDRLDSLRDRYRRLFPVPRASADLFLFRLFKASETSTRSLRRDLDDLLLIRN